ncbi:hypothetical protein M427DRAFT_416802 [Gonapodya prolifera JEL478]|uniref:Uncharacterized protein n=1 Tax=Gonapodya prolifera (strain JEL478) TaxID=1344416 RepID=A0A139A550_GONPJ|nr:hypothetical protein M427DRAFT_416802 [Gonapodya prolifera JEL478]|eukprot:KXS11937.1 hypothetical protein M427DRAFT_416802 [Gonapodya prolifera JEL478]
MGLPKSFSDKPFDQLVPITFGEIMATMTHRGRYLLVRTISLAVFMVGFNVAVEDTKGQVSMLGIYNFPLHGMTNGARPRRPLSRGHRARRPRAHVQIQHSRQRPPPRGRPHRRRDARSGRHSTEAHATVSPRCSPLELGGGL